MKCCDLTPGMLRIPVDMQRETRTADGQGGYERTWQTYATVQAHLRQTSGAERTESGRLTFAPALECVLRYRDDVEPQHRLLYDGKAYQIRVVDDVEFRKRWLRLRLEGGVAT